MTNYEVFKRASPENMAVLLTSMAASLADIHDPLKIREIYDIYLELLGKKTELAFLVADDDVDPDHFTRKLYAARKTAGLTQRDMAARLGVPLRSFQYWEKGERLPADHIQRRILQEIENPPKE